MEKMKFCQSCSMPLAVDTDYGTEKDGRKSDDYCQYCYQDGVFKDEMTMAQMIEFCIPHVSQGQPFNSEDEARTQMAQFFPTLKRWKQ